MQMPRTKHGLSAATECLVMPRAFPERTRAVLRGRDRRWQQGGHGRLRWQTAADPCMVPRVFTKNLHAGARAGMLQHLNAAGSKVGPGSLRSLKYDEMRILRWFCRFTFFPRGALEQ